METGTKVKYQVRKKSLEILYGRVIGFKEDKILVTQSYKDMSTVRPIPTWISKEDIIKVVSKPRKSLTKEQIISIINQ
jgi:hypothetical protein